MQKKKGSASSLFYMQKIHAYVILGVGNERVVKSSGVCMKKYNWLVFIFTVTTVALCEELSKTGEEQSNLVLLDQIEVVVFGQEDVEIVTKSDIDRPALGGGYRTEDEIIFERSVLLDAKKHKIPNDEEAVDAGIEQMKREHDLSDDDLEMIFKESGYTLQEGRQQFQVMQMINTMLDVKVRSNLIVPRRDVEAYYNANPEVVEATYTIERLFIPFDQKKSKTRQRREIEKYVETGVGALEIQPGFVFTINHSDVAQQKQFIFTMEQNQLSAPQEIAGGFELLRLIEKTPEHFKTLDERYREIVDVLRRPKYEELMQKYRDQLMQQVSVVRL